MKKKLSVKDQSACMACLACEVACSEAFYKKYDPDNSCIHIIEKKGATKTQVCVQCGKCAKACEHEAITQNAKGVYTIDKKKCVKCGKCVEACPFQVMVLDEGKETPSKCIACGICVKACPVDVLEIKEIDK
ncbi:Energy conserving hydrogenase Ehb polyferredoxin (protein K) [Lachnospiraceae bacterium TWA4]|nr:Energy conserving hydrogenase Ehb polyferredoxin (protein K) [Lachnospiraceae bacterium TWA4]